MSINTQAQLNRQIPPAGKALEHFVLREVKKTPSLTGPEFYYFEDRQQKAIRLEWLFSVGPRHENAPGTRSMFCKMLKEGTTQYNASELADILDGYGAFLEPIISADRCGLALYALDKHLPNLLPLFKSLITDATFPARELEIQKETARQELSVNKEKTSFLSKEKYRELLFGSTHPYAQKADENLINQISTEELKNFRDNTLLKSASYILVTGNTGALSPEEIHAYFNDIPDSTLEQPSYPEVIPQYISHHVNKADAQQASLKMGLHLPGKKHPDHFPLLFLNKVLGGYFGSRLMQNLREQKGYTYGIRSELGFLEHASYLTISADVVKEHLDAAVGEIQKEINRLCHEAIPDDELNSVRQYILGSFLSSLSNSFSVADKFKNLYHSGMNYSYYSEWIDAVKTMKAETLKDTAQKYFAHHPMVIVTCG